MMRRPRPLLRGPQVPLAVHLPEALTHELDEPTRSRITEFALGLLFGLLGPVFVAGIAWGYWTVPATAPAGLAGAASLVQPGPAVASTLGSGAVSVSWTEPDRQVPGSRYVVVRTTGPGAPAPVCDVPAGTSSCTDSGLIPGSQYAYSVSARIASWRSAARTSGATTRVPSFAVEIPAGAHAAGSSSAVTVRAMLDGRLDPTYTGARPVIWSGLAAAPDGRRPVYPSSTPSFVAGVASPGSVVAFRRGSAQLTVVDSAQPAVVGTSSLDVGPAPVAEIVLSERPSSVVASAGASSGPFTVMLHDAYGNDVPVEDEVPVQVSSGSATAVISAAAGGPASSSVTVAPGSSTASFWLGDTRSGTTTLTAAAAGVTAVLGSLDVAPTVAARVVLTSAGLSGTAASSATLGPVTAVVQDQFGNPVPAPLEGRTLTLSSTSAGAAFALKPGGTAVSTITLPAGSSSGSFYYGDTRSGTPTTTVASPGLATAAQAHAISAGPPSRLAFVSAATSGPSSLTPSLGPISVQRQDSFGNAVTSGTATVGLVSSSATATFAASAGGSATTSVVIAAGSSSASFWYGDPRAGAPVITATSTGLAAATQTQAVAASKLAIISSALSGTASATANLGPVTVQMQDASGAAATAGPTGLGISLASSTTGTAVFAATSGGAATSALTIPAGSSSVTFFYGDTKAGMAAVSVSAAGVTAATQNATISAGPAARVGITSASATGTASTSATIGPITVSQTDAFGNPVPVQQGGGLTVSLASGSSGSVFFATTSGGSSAATVTIPKNSSSATVWYADTRAGTPTLTVSASGLASGTQAQTITPAAPSRLVVTSSAVSGAASSTASTGPVSVGLQDAYGNTATAAAGGVTVTPTSTSAGTVVFAAADGATPTSAVQVAAGTSSTAVWFGDTRSGTPTLSFAAPGLAGASQAQTVSAAAASTLQITSSAVSGPASSSATLGPIVVAVRDRFGNAAPAPAGGLAVSVSSSTTGTAVFAAASGGSSTAAVAVAAGSSTASFYYADTRAGAPTLTAAAAGLTSAAQTATITAGPASRLTITSSALSGAAGTAATLGPVVVQQQDVFGNPVSAGSATSLALSSSSTGAVFATTSAGSAVTSVSIASGSSSAAFFYGDSRTGAPTITVARTGLSSATQAATITTTPKRLVLSGSLSGSASSTALLGPATVQLQDDLGNVVAAPAATTVALASSTGTGVFYAASGGTAVTSVTIPAGSSSATFYYGDTKAGSPTITTSATGLTPSTTTASVSSGTASALTLSSSTTSTTASTTAVLGPITVTQVDAFGNPVTVVGATSVTVSLTSSSTGTPVFSSTSGGSSVTSVPITTGRSSATFYYGDTRAGAPTLTASSTGRTGATLGLTISAAAPSKLVFTTSALSGKSSSAATLGPIGVGLQDQFGNVATAAAAVTVNLTSTSSAGVFAATSRGTSITSVTVAAGSSAASYYYNSSTAGTWTMTATAAGLTSATQSITTT